MPLTSLSRKHIQDYGDAASLQHHWGYADRVIPCTNDNGSCAYLDAVYSAHDNGMVYTGIFWLTIAVIVIPWAGWRLRTWLQGGPLAPPHARRQGPTLPFASRLKNAISAALRRHLMPEAASRPLTAVFGHTTRLQMLVLAMLVGYLCIWSFVGITYNTWITPVKASPGLYNHRSSIGPWADRVGVLAYALTPLSILLGARESLLSTLTGVPYQSFLFLHRWVGYVIVIQSVFHTMGWCLVEGRYYQPQPTTWRAFVSETYIVWGFVAFVLLLLLLLLLLLTLPMVYNRLGGYETFRKAHYVLAMAYIGAAIGHWKKLACFLVPSLGLWGADRGLRLVRSFILHSSGQCPGKKGAFFAPTPARVSIFEDPADGDVVRLDFYQPEPAPWEIGMHYYLCFTEGSIWQSHPFTPLNDPEHNLKQIVTDEYTYREKRTLLVSHSYIFRAKGGETKKIAQIVAQKIQAAAKEQAAEKIDSTDSTDNTSPLSSDAEPADALATTPVILTGPYGQGYMGAIANDTNILCVAGGTGVTFVLPVLLRMARLARLPRAGASQRKLRLIWAVRRQSALSWIAAELQRLRESAHDIHVDIYVTDETPAAVPPRFTDFSAAAEDAPSAGGEDKATPPPSSSGGGLEDLTHVRTSGGRPDLPALVAAFVADTISGPTAVVASGPVGMITTLRKAVAGSNAPEKVWKGDMRHSVRLIVDDRIE